MELSREMAGQLYQEHEGKEFYDSLLDHMTRLAINNKLTLDIGRSDIHVLTVRGIPLVLQ